MQSLLAPYVGCGQISQDAASFSLELLSQGLLAAKLAGTNLPLPLRCQLARSRQALSLGPCPAPEHSDSPRPGLSGCLTLHCVIFLLQTARLLPEFHNTLPQQRLTVQGQCQGKEQWGGWGGGRMRGSLLPQTRSSVSTTSPRHGVETVRQS